MGSLEAYFYIPLRLESSFRHAHIPGKERWEARIQLCLEMCLQIFLRLKMGGSNQKCQNEYVDLTK